MTPVFQTAADVFDRWRDDVLTGSPPTLYPLGAGDLERIEVGPGLVTLIGGAPGAGKTAFTMQAVIDALHLTSGLRARVCSIEMPPAILLDRQLARLSGVDVTTIRSRQLDETHAERLEVAMNTLEPLMDRLCFVRPPFDLDNVAGVADEFEADLLLLDYIQRIPPPGEHGDRRSSVDATMNYLRQFADAGQAVIVVAAVARTRDSRGRSSYDGAGLNLASFRESSELEFGADDAFILVPASQGGGDMVTLRHLKARHTQARDVELYFDRPRQSFTCATSDAGRAQGGMQQAMSLLWEQTPMAESEEHDA